MFIQLITTKQHFGHHLKLSLREAAINTLMCTLIQFALWSTNLCLCWNSQFASLLGGKWYCQICIICSTSRGKSESYFWNWESIKIFLCDDTLCCCGFIFYFILFFTPTKEKSTFSSPSSFRLMMSRSKSVRRPVVLLNDSLPVKPSQWDWKVISTYWSLHSQNKFCISYFVL